MYFLKTLKDFVLWNAQEREGGQKERKSAEGPKRENFA